MKEIKLLDNEWNLIEEKLGKIRDRLGPYKMDRLEHAESVIENGSENAVQVLELLRRATIPPVVSPVSPPPGGEG